jgi:hypothetical protein
MPRAGAAQQRAYIYGLRIEAVEAQQDQPTKLDAKLSERHGLPDVKPFTASNSVVKNARAARRKPRPLEHISVRWQPES